MTVYKKHVSEPWFSLIQQGIKTVEGRINKGDFAKMTIGDTIIFTNTDVDWSVTIKDIKIYNTFEEYLNSETLERCLPHTDIQTIEDGLKVYYQYYSTHEEREFGVKAFIF